MMDKNLQSLEQNLTSWTDDVPTCKDSGVGSCWNEMHRKDGRRAQIHDFEDRSFRFHREEYNLCLYGVFDGYDGAHVADYIMKRLPAELVLGQIVPDVPDEQIKELIKQAFISIDKEYFGSIGEKLAARMVMRSENIRPEQHSLLAELEQFVRSGCSATIAVVISNKIFIANTGDCQAFLCYTDDSAAGDDDLTVTPVSVDHTLDNEDEALRLHHLGLHLTDADMSVGSQRYTRCFGNYLVKGGYKESPGLSECREDPVIAEPEIQGPVTVTDNLQMLIITTRSLIQAVRTFSDDPPQQELCHLLMHHLTHQPSVSLSSVVQSTLDHIVRRMEDTVREDSIIKREDMTLLVRCFKPSQSSHQLLRRQSSPR